MNEQASKIVTIDPSSEYFKSASLLSESNSANLVSNGMIEHAAVLMLLMLRKCKDSVRLVSTKISADLYTNPSILDAIQDALRNDVKFTILVREDPDQASIACFRKLDRADKLQIFKMASKGLENDFAVVDEKAFRFEEVDCHNAVASFNRPDLASILQRKFDAAVSNCTDPLLMPS